MAGSQVSPSSLQRPYLTYLIHIDHRNWHIDSPLARLKQYIIWHHLTGGHLHKDPQPTPPAAKPSVHYEGMSGSFLDKTLSHSGPPINTSRGNGEGENKQPVC